MAGLELHSCYELDVIDDLADRLGKRENPKIYAPQKNLVWDRYKEKAVESWFNFAEVDRLREIRQVYTKAKNVAEHSEKLIGVSKDSLNILRRDSLEHENIAVQEISTHKYNCLLNKLINQ